MQGFLAQLYSPQTVNNVFSLWPWCWSAGYSEDEMWMFCMLIKSRVESRWYIFCLIPAILVCSVVKLASWGMKPSAKNMLSAHLKCFLALGVSTKVAEPKNKNWIWTLKHVLICRLYLKVLFYLIWTAPQSSNEKEKQTFNPFCDFSEHNINQETSQLQAMVACWLILKP